MHKTVVFSISSLSEQAAGIKGRIVAVGRNRMPKGIPPKIYA